MKDIKNYEGRYAITSCGKVWSYISKKFLKPKVDKDGYLAVTLHKDGKSQTFSVHRLVAMAYIPNPNNLPEVNHKDEFKDHNWGNNLEWCDHTYNINYGTCRERIGDAHRGVSKGGKAVYCPELNEAFWGVSEASVKYNLDQGTLSKCCNGQRKSCGKHPVTGEPLHWEWVGDQQ